MDGKVIIGTDLDTRSFDAQIDYVKGQLDDIEDKLKKADMGFEVGDVQKLEAQYERLTDKLRKLVKQKEEFNKPNFSGVNVQLQNIGSSLTKVVKKVTRWGLAVFGIRSAYMAVRNAINVISQDDEQLKADIDYIKTALAYTLEPVARRIVELAKQLLLYIGYLIKAWTGKNIFENANKGLKKSVGSAKELRKQLAGFDEMNILSDSSSGGGGATPSVDFAKELANIEPPKWLLTIERIGKWILENWQDVVSVLLLTKLFIDILTGNWIGVIIDLVLLLIALFFKLKDAIGVIKDNWKDAWNVIKEHFSGTIQKIKDKFTSLKDFLKNTISSIVSLFKNIGTKVGDAIGGAFKAVINSVLRAVENILNFPIRSINSLIKTINKIPGINLGTLNTFSLPRLAKGGIINMPGRGVPVGSAIGGERGAEGVIPLTDSQQMALLGEAIGKYININATIPVYVGNRMIKREIERKQAEDNFAYNR